jgi:hypothetical protein
VWRPADQVWGRSRRQVCVNCELRGVCGVLTAGQVHVGLKPCALCQGCTGAFFRIDELPAFLIKPSVTSQQNKNPTQKKRMRWEERQHVWEICHLQSLYVEMWCAGALTFITRLLKTNSYRFFKLLSLDSSSSFWQRWSFHNSPNLLFISPVSLWSKASFFANYILYFWQGTKLFLVPVIIMKCAFIKCIGL